MNIKYVNNSLVMCSLMLIVFLGGCVQQSVNNAPYMRSIKLKTDDRLNNVLIEKTPDNTFTFKPQVETLAVASESGVVDYDNLRLDVQIPKNSNKWSSGILWVKQITNGKEIRLNKGRRIGDGRGIAGDYYVNHDTESDVNIVQITPIGSYLNSRQLMVEIAITDADNRIRKLYRKFSSQKM